MSEAEHRIPLEQDTPEYLVYAQYKINDNDPGRWRKVYVTAEYLLKHLPKADVLNKIQQWRAPGQGRRGRRLWRSCIDLARRHQF